MADREISSPQDLMDFMNSQGAAGSDKVDQGNDRRIKRSGSDRWTLLFAGKILSPSRDEVDSSPRPLLSRSVNRRPPAQLTRSKNCALQLIGNKGNATANCRR